LIFSALARLCADVVELRQQGSTTDLQVDIPVALRIEALPDVFGMSALSLAGELESTIDKRESIRHRFSRDQLLQQL
jgi:hypothetical protein